jgi:hypothetical protein
MTGAPNVGQSLSIVGKHGRQASLSNFVASGSLKWITYVRKSLDDGNDNLSLTDQTGMIADWSKGRGDVVLETFQELASGALPKGTGFAERKELFSAFRRVLESPDVSGLVVVRLDRLSRDMVST